MTESDNIRPPIESVPSIIEQAEALGWKAGYYNFGKAEEPGIDYFNPGLVERPDGLWLMVRRSDSRINDGFGMNSVLAIKLDEAGTKPIGGLALKWPNAQPGQQFEDARAFYVPHMNQVAVSACTFVWNGANAVPAWTGAIQVIGFFDQDWNCKVMHYPPFDTNGTSLQVVPREAFQKNWLWWHRNDKLHLLYKSDPWMVATFKNNWLDGRMVHVGKGVTWGYGPIRGGTPPIEIDCGMLTIMHSSTPWYDRWRRYHAGAVLFNPEPPFEPLWITPEPFISGTTVEHWAPRKPACIFPTGMVKRGDRVLISSGVNDLKSAWFDAPIESIMSRMVRIGSAPVPVNGAPEVQSKPAAAPEDAKRAAMLARMAKARAARGKKKKVKK